MTGTGEAVAFWILATIAVLAALGLLFARKAVHAALSMATTMVILGIFYIGQGAPFLGIVQIFVYACAVMMLFLFVLMLVGVDSSDSMVETLKGQKWIIGRITIAGEPSVAAINAEQGNISVMAELIFSKYVWVFEITSALLITAALGAMVLAHRERLGEKADQREWARRRFQRNEHVAGLPAPGVYARHNAVDTPALLPDGSPSLLSVSRTLAALPGRLTDAHQVIEAEAPEGESR